MNSGVVFVCGRLEPGHDGVGDYTRTLAMACAGAGVPVALIALNDSSVHGAALREDYGFPVLRLPARSVWAENVPAAADFIKATRFSWVSFQFVCYTYGNRGLVWGLAEKLGPLFEGRNLHVMFHEIWIGVTPEASLKNRLVGQLQRLLIRDFARKVHPKIVHTSNLPYMSLLGSIGLRPKRLPLLGNIPVQQTDASEWLYHRLRDANIEITGQTRSEFLIFGFFGILHPDWPPEPLLGQLEEFAQRSGKKLIMLSFGKLSTGEALWDRLSAQYSGGSMKWCKLGLISALEVSQLMNSVDFGVAATPLSLLEKSGTAACFLEHGLPLIVNRNDCCFSGINSEDGMSSQCVLNWKNNFIEKLMSSRRYPVVARGPAVRDQFLRDLGLDESTSRPLPLL